MENRKLSEENLPARLRADANDLRSMSQLANPGWKPTLQVCAKNADAAAAAIEARDALIREMLNFQQVLAEETSWKFVESRWRAAVVTAGQTEVAAPTAYEIYRADLRFARHHGKPYPWELHRLVMDIAQSLGIVAKD